MVHLHMFYPFSVSKSMLSWFFKVKQIWITNFVIYGVQVVTDLDGNFILQIGSTGEEGFRDGSFDDAMFNRPQVIFFFLILFHGL